VHLLLGCVDALRAMLANARDGSPFDAAGRDALQAALASAAHAGTTPAAATRDPGCGHASPTGDGAATARWAIEFAPNADLLRKGNDPLLILRELARLGTLRADALLDALPPLADLDPQSCHLAWRLELEGAVQEAQIRELFEWVELDCVLGIRRVDPQPPAQEEPQVTAAAPPAAPEPTAARPDTPRAAAAADAGSIRVATRKIDQLINLVGELVITQSMLARFAQGIDPSELEALRDGLAQLARNTRDLQEGVMQVRMLPVSFVFSRFPRLVRDASAALGKHVELELSGEQTEVDKTVLERIADPLVHLVRNALDHGIESPAERIAAGKPAVGRLRLRAWHESGSVVIEIDDDGRGLDRGRILRKAIERGMVKQGEALSDEEVCQLIFAPGFSTAEAVTDLSGRGVGMDVVRKNIQDLSGRVSLSSTPGAGTTVQIRLPLTLAIVDGQLVRAADQVLIVPLLNIVETVQLSADAMQRLPNGQSLVGFREGYLPVASLSECLFQRQGAGRLLVVAEAQGLRIGLIVDELLGQQQVVIKNLETNCGAVPGVAGATIMGDGSVALIVDVAGCYALARRIERDRRVA
jgi:two-component system chemotaxis sensor kinase CheA